MNNDNSTQPCGCDLGCRPEPHVCEWHQMLVNDGWKPLSLEGENVASREAAGLDKPQTTGQCRVVGAYDAGSASGGSTPSVGNGPQQGFTTGATRSTNEGKVDYEGHLNPDVLAVFGEYMHAHRVQRDGQLRASDNWQKGIPTYRYVKSLIRHTFEFWRMWRGTIVRNPDSGAHFTFREVLGAMLFNVMGIIFEATQRHPEFLDSQALPGWRRELWEREDQPSSESK